MKHYFRKTYFLNLIFTIALFFASHYYSGSSKLIFFFIGTIWLFITVAQAYTVAYYRGRADEDNGNRYQNSKRWFIILPLALLFAGCNNTAEQNFNVLQERFPEKWATVEIDSCEYITYSPGSKEGMLTHKGNCKFCIERSAK